MSAASAASSTSKSKSPKATTENSGGPFRPALPMKPRPALFRILMGVLIVWCGVMVWMYLRTIHPSPPSPSQQPAATERAVAQQTP